MSDDRKVEVEVYGAGDEMVEMEAHGDKRVGVEVYGTVDEAGEMKAYGAGDETVEMEMMFNLEKSESVPELGEETEDRIFNWVVKGLLNVSVFGGTVHSGTIGLCWRDFQGSRILELDLSAYTGNGSGLWFAYRDRDLLEYLESGETFQLPFAQFRPVKREAFCLEKLDGEVSYLPGRLISRRKMEPMEHVHNLNDLDFLITRSAEAKNFLVRIVFTDRTLDRLIRENDDDLFALLTRDDLLAERWIENRFSLWDESEIFLVVSAEEARRLGLLREEFLG